MSSDGSRLRESWSNALKNAQAWFRSLLVSSTTGSWKRVSIKSPSKDIASSSVGTAPLSPGPFHTNAISSHPDISFRSSTPQRAKSQSKGKGKLRRQPLIIPDVTDVVVHRIVSKDGPGEVLRAVLDVTLGDDIESLRLSQLSAWRAVLSTPQMRKEYDPAVQDGHILEMFDTETRVAKLDFALGWPANPRDAVTISRSFMDASTLIEVSTSLPRSVDEPAYLRPAPPFVRSYVHLFAWCIQVLQPPPEMSSTPLPVKLRITYFWQHDLKALWNIKTSIIQNLPAVLVGLVKVVLSSGNRLSFMTGYGHGIGISHMDCHAARQLLSLEYRVTHDGDEDDGMTPTSPVDDMDDVQAKKEARRLERSIEWLLPGSQSWDVRINTRKPYTLSSLLPEWVVHATQPAAVSDDPFLQALPEPITLRLSHSRPPENSIVGATVAIEPSGGAAGTMRVNGSNHPIQIIQLRDPFSFQTPHRMLEDASTIGNICLDTRSSTSISTAVSIASSTTGSPRRVVGVSPPGRSGAAQKAISNLVRRNYIYFTSLLQEPEAKWSKAITESRGVTVTRLNSIDPTLVVYRAEAVFVGVSVWDLLSAVVAPGVTGYWNKIHEDAVFLEHVNELTELWHLKLRAAWPVNARDSIQLRTTYKSPTASHVFSFSTDDAQLFPTIQPSEPGTIRTQVDLQGWAIEALSPNTTLLTLLDQSDPKGWSNKSSIPSQMIAAVAGIGEFSIKHGGPPMATRISGAKYINSRYDHDRNVFRLDCQSTQPKTPPSSNLPTPSSEVSEDATPQANTVELPSVQEDGGSSISSSLSPSFFVDSPTTIECEISLDIIADPAPQTISCLRRHKFASQGGGVWITIEHDGALLTDERLTVVVRKGPGGKERGSVVVNGVKARVDVEELPEEELKALSKRRRIKPTRHPLDRPPVMTVRRRAGTYDDEPDTPVKFSFTRPRMTKILTLGLMPQPGSTQSQESTIQPNRFDRSKPPMDYAFDALARVRAFGAASVADGWTALGSKDVPVYKKLVPDVHSSIAVHKAQKVIEGFSAEDLVTAVSYGFSRSQWDTSLDSVTPLQSFGSGCQTFFIVSKLGLPFRDRAFFLASVLAKTIQEEEAEDDMDLGVPRPRSLSINRPVRAAQKAPTSRPCTYIYVTTSFGLEPPRSLTTSLINPSGYPVGQVLLEGWVLETLDPYTDENLAIPSTKCTLVSAIDLAGSVPSGYNASYIASFVTRSIGALEKYMKGRSISPSLSIPPSAVGLDDRQTEPIVGAEWVVENGDPERSFLGSLVSSEPPSQRFCILIKPRWSSKESTRLPHTSSTSRPSTPVKDGNGQASPHDRGTDSLRGDYARAHSHGPQPSSTMRRRLLSLPSSTGRPRSGEVSDSGDNFLIGEVIVDPTSFARGYEVKVGTELLPLDPSHWDLGCKYPTSTPPTAMKHSFPTSCKIEQVPPSPLSSNSLSSLHRLRFFVLSGSHTSVPIDDPLREHLLELQPKPDWFLNLERQGALTDILITPTDTSLKTAVMVDGEAVPVIAENGSSVLLDRKNGTRDVLLPVLTRAPTPGDSPKSVRRPLASSWHFFVNPPPSESPTTSASSEIAEEVAAPSTPDAGAPITTQAVPETSNSLLELFNSYSNPLLKRSSEGPFTFNYWQNKPSLPIPGRWLSRSPSDTSTRTSQKAIPTNNQDKRSTISLVSLKDISSRLLSHRFTLPTVFIIALIAFLLGSLLRSLLSPADFVLQYGEASPNAHHWHEVKRLLDVHFFGRGLIVAVVRH
ncbi:uncharacterized protein EI90DRAFT_3072733 [Cantharellus anzutake]|uniref:uncharacterized protein n=1 Tax=Cantharellus anzutake TaxID=1750568 RepID=UPI00190492D1|nr:uncharacterized protein EI90DRAFT_3072733 [Cantharellus anzutake]KAF8325403.1 hypothetical protein EI90DRAFT_3072733 [Cantharellus anzutake]